MHVAVPPDFEAFISRQIASGFYHTAGEVVCAGLELLDKQSKEHNPPPTLDYVLETLRRHEAALRERGIVHIAVFGSIVRGEADKRSDLDLAIDVDASRRLGVIGFAGLIGVLAEMFAPYRVDVVERSGTGEAYVRENYEREAVRAF